MCAQTGAFSDGRRRLSVRNFGGGGESHAREKRALCQRRLLFRFFLPLHGFSDAIVYSALRVITGNRLVSAHYGGALAQQTDPPKWRLHRAGTPSGPSHRQEVETFCTAR